VKTGDRIRVVDIPSDLPDNELRTAEIFRRCLGRIFPVATVAHVEDREFLELEVGEICGEAPYMQTIWIESEFVELVEA
jgi:hypothetical protein